jgi:SAM-dependent methyltransferase
MEVQEETGFIVEPGGLIGVYATPFRDDRLVFLSAENVDTQEWQPDGEIAARAFFARHSLPEMRPRTRARLDDPFEGRRGVRRMSETAAYRPPDVAAAWGHPDVAESYRHRPHYPPQTFDILSGLIVDDSPAVLDLGCGTGFIARPLAPLVHRVDAVDISAAMIEEGKNLPGGDHPGITWIVGRAEDVALHPPYALATTGDSLHWMEWGVVLPRLVDALSPAGWLAILTTDGTIITEDQTVEEEVLHLIERYSTYWRPNLRLLEELKRHGLFHEQGRAETGATVLRQSVDDYVESFHARASLSWGRLTSDDAAAFDASLKQLMLDRVGATVEQAVRASIIWGKPSRP